MCDRLIQVAVDYTGQRVQFEVESQALGIRRILQTDYIPDMLAVGEVLEIGFGSGATLPFYDPAKVSSLTVVEPSAL